jgi:hypothetical protein
MAEEAAAAAEVGKAIATLGEPRPDPRIEQLPAERVEAVR